MLTLIGTALSPYAMRVMIAARFKGIDLNVEAPPGGSRAPSHLKINPMGRVPVLIDGELALPESDVILSYLEDRQPTPTLFPGDAATRANVRLVARLLDTYSTPSFGAFAAGTDAFAVATALERIDAALGYIDHYRRQGEFAVADAFSAADCALMPVFCIYEGLQRRYAVFDLVRKRPRLEAWWLRARESELGSFTRDAMGAAFRALRTS